MQCYVVLNIILIAVPPPIKHIQETKTMHTRTLQLLKHLCTKVEDLEAEEIFSQSFINGAKYGIPEILEEIIKSYPFALEYLDEDVFKLAVLNRYEKIFNLICETGMHRQLIIRTRDDTNNDNILHLAGKLALRTGSVSFLVQLYKCNASYIGLR